MCGVSVVLEPHAEVANLLGWLNEGSSDIVIANDAEIEGHIGLFCVTNGRGYTGIGNRDNDIGVQVTFPSQLCADLLRRYKRYGFPTCCRAGEVYVFKIQNFCGRLLKGLTLCRPFSSMTTISPGSTSRMNSAPMISRAHVSDVKIVASPRRPSTSGRTPGVAYTD